MLFSSGSNPCGKGKEDRPHFFVESGDIFFSTTCHKINLPQFLFSRSAMMGRDNDQAGQTICDFMKVFEIAGDNRCPDLPGSQSNQKIIHRTQSIRMSGARTI